MNSAFTRPDGRVQTMGGDDWTGWNDGVPKIQSSDAVTIGDGSDPSFALLNKVSSACAIQMETQVVITGGPGWPLSRNVSVYDMFGWRADLPQMNMGRALHGCGYYRNNNDQIVYIVVGGSYENVDTEKLISGDSAWTTLPYMLPVQITGMASVSLNKECEVGALRLYELEHSDGVEMPTASSNSVTLALAALLPISAVLSFVGGSRFAKSRVQTEEFDSLVVEE